MDTIGSKGTGLWSVQEALAVGEPVPSLAAAVLARQMSMARPVRLAVSRAVGDERRKGVEQPECNVDELYHAVYLAIVASYAQMFSAMRAVDRAFSRRASRLTREETDRPVRSVPPAARPVRDSRRPDRGPGS